MGCCLSIEEEPARQTRSRPDIPKGAVRRPPNPASPRPVATVDETADLSSRRKSSSSNLPPPYSNSTPSSGSSSLHQSSTRIGYSAEGKVVSVTNGNQEVIIDASLREFSYQELQAATRKFRDSGKLGEGGFGTVYKGVIDGTTHGGGEKVAVKMLSLEGMQGESEWMAEVRYLGELRHPNLVRLVGYCAEEDHRLLVYEFMEFGSMERYLFSHRREPLPWPVRVKVALHAARGLAFLHDQTEKQVIYRDLKTSNILVDRDFNAKLSDFGLARDGPEDDQTHVSTRVMGTYGYAAPEYVMTGHLTSKSDVYSFGVVLLEMISGRRAMEMEAPQGEQGIVEWAKPFFRDRAALPGLLDRKLQGLPTSPPPKAVARAALLAQSCVKVDQKDRLPMSDVVKSLEAVLNMSTARGVAAAAGSGAAGGGVG